MLIARAALLVAFLATPVVASRADDAVTVSQAVAAAYAGGGNASTINQMGSNNSAATFQLGAQNAATIGQFGNNNQSTIIQTGVGGLAINNQYGNGNQMTITQTGPRPQPIIITQRR